MRHQVDDTDMTAEEFRALGKRGVPAKVVTSRAEYQTELHGRTHRSGARFEVYEDRAGKFRFRLKASSGTVLATSEAYSTRADARRGVEAVMAAAESAQVVEVAS